MREIAVDFSGKGLIIVTIEQRLMEARSTSVAPKKAAGTARVKGKIAEGYPLSRADMPGPREKIPRTVTLSGGELSEAWESLPLS